MFGLFIHWCRRSLWNAVGVWSVYTQHKYTRRSSITPFTVGSGMISTVAKAWECLAGVYAAPTHTPPSPFIFLFSRLPGLPAHTLLAPPIPCPTARPPLTATAVFFAFFPLIGLCFKSYTPRLVSCLMCSVSYCERQRLVCLHKVWRLNNLSAQPTHCSVSKLRSQCL